MSLRVTINVVFRGSDQGPREEEFDLILHTVEGGDDSLEIADLDMEAATAAAALGLDEYDHALYLYDKYVEDGLESLIDTHASELYKAFEKQGYDVFEDEEFDKDTFLNIIGQKIRDFEGYTGDHIDLLESIVKAGGYDKDEFVDDLLVGLETVADPDMHWSDHDAVSLYLPVLRKLLPKEAFVFSANDPDIYEEDVASAEATLGYDITINKHVVISWGRTLYGRITDPVTFDVDVTDPCDDNPESCPPQSAEMIMDAMGWYYPLEPDVFQNLPERDNSGDFGVAYTKHAMETTAYARRRTGEVFEPRVIPYETPEEAEEAAKLSLEILEHRNDNSYDIEVVAYDYETQSWIPYVEEN